MIARVERGFVVELHACQAAFAPLSLPTTMLCRLDLGHIGPQEQNLVTHAAYVCGILVPRDRIFLLCMALPVMGDPQGKRATESSPQHFVHVL